MSHTVAISINIFIDPHQRPNLPAGANRPRRDGLWPSARGLRSKGGYMSRFLDRMTFFRRRPEPFAQGHGITTHEDRSWEDGYRKRWSHDKIARSTHGV